VRTWPAPSPGSSWSITAVPVARTGTATRPERLFAEEGPGEPDFASAVKWAGPAAEAGSAKAQAVLAYVLTCGPEEMRDLEKAHRWY